MKKKLLGVSIAVLVLVFLGCPVDDPSTEPNYERNPVYGINLDVTSISYYGPTGTGFQSPQPLAVTVTNTGNTHTQTLNLKLVFENETGLPAIKPIAIIDGNWAAESFVPTIPPGKSAQFQVYFSPEDPGTVVTYKAKVEISNGNIPKKEVSVTYSTFTATQAAIGLSGTGPLIKGESGRSVTTIGGAAGSTFFSNNPSIAAIADDGSLTLNGTGKVFVGSTTSTNPLTVKGDWVGVVEDPADASRATLKNLTVNGATVPGFAADSPPVSGGYTIPLAYTVAEVKVAAHLSDGLAGLATLENGALAEQLAPGDSKTITVKVVSADGSVTNTYDLYVSRVGIAAINSVTALYNTPSPFSAYLPGLGLVGIGATGASATDTSGNVVTIPARELQLTNSPAAGFSDTTGAKGNLTFRHTVSGVTLDVPLTVRTNRDDTTKPGASGTTTWHLGMAATASTNTAVSGTNTAAGAVNGNAANYGWATTSANEYPKTLTLRWPGKVKINRVVIWQENNAQRIGEFTFTYYEAEEWKEALHETTAGGTVSNGRSVWTFSTVETDGLRLNIMGPRPGTTAYNPTILEMEVFYDPDQP